MIHHHLQLILLILAIIFYQHESTSFVAPITKHNTDSINPLYSTQIMTKYVNFDYIHNNFLIDIEAPITWYNCTVLDTFSAGPDSGCPGNTICLAPVTCEEYQCTDVRTSSPQPSSCPPVTNTSMLPTSGVCACPVSVVNPITNSSCVEPVLNYGELWFHETDGRTWFPGASGVYPLSACAPSSAFDAFPDSVIGMLALSSSSHALPAYLFYGFEASFALCLPNTVSSHGALFIGGGPYFLQSHVGNNTDVDVESLLSYTPLLSQDENFGYFIAVESIVIKKRSINIPANATTKITTIEAYTALRTDIYNQVIRRFSMVTRRLVPAKPVAPFGLCFNTNGSQARLKVPDIVFGLPDGKKWAISTANSMIRVTKEVACLAFVDGGPTSEHAIVIGTFQMEDNFLVFDLVNSSLGFSSSLLNKGTSCASFNFTSI